MPGSFWAVTTTWAEIIILFFLLEYHMSNGGVSTNKLRNPKAAEW